MITTKNLLETIEQIAIDAGKAIMEVYATNFSSESKSDQSPLTLADKLSNEVIVRELKNSFPEIPIISEENKQLDYSERKNWSRFWLVDPLDGTKEFIKRNGEFTVNIALIENGTPVAGVVFIPVQNILFSGSTANGSFKTSSDGVRTIISTKKNAGEIFHVVASRSHMSDETKLYVEELGKSHNRIETISAGSSLKFTLVAEGKAQVYPRFGPTMEWDTAAGQAVVECAGGSVTDAKTGESLRYNKESLLNPFFIVKA